MSLALSPYSTGDDSISDVKRGTSGAATVVAVDSPVDETLEMEDCGETRLLFPQVEAEYVLNGENPPNDCAGELGPHAGMCVLRDGIWAAVFEAQGW
jgi:hypothetical protein